MNKLTKIFALLIAVSAFVFAQSTTASVTANVSATLTIISTQNLNLGNVAQGGTVTVNGNAATAARFTITGAGNAATTVTVTTPTDLTSGANTLPFTAVNAYYGTTNAATPSTSFGATTGGSANTNASGNLFVFVGGSVTAGASQAAGAYSGTITVAVTQP
ncbi:MAG: DUF4402 domain-containing protein [Bacteroidetes bacterium]|nr:DUF4402 domain-containing protein [Bacteroidota bacterium]